MSPAFGEKKSIGMDNNGSIRNTNTSASKRNLFSKKQHQEVDEINDQRPEELKTGI